MLDAVFRARSSSMPIELAKKAKLLAEALLPLQNAVRAAVYRNLEGKVNCGLRPRLTSDITESELQSVLSSLGSLGVPSDCSQVGNVESDMFSPPVGHGLLCPSDVPLGSEHALEKYSRYSGQSMDFPQTEKFFKSFLENDIVYFEAYRLVIKAINDESSQQPYWGSALKRINKILEEKSAVLDLDDLDDLAPTIAPTTRNGSESSASDTLNIDDLKID